MNPTLNHINYLTAPVSFFGNQNSAAHTGYPQFPHSRSYPSFQDVPSANDQSDYVDHSATRVGTPSGLSPGTNNWESYDQERPQTPSFVGSGERRVKDIHHYEMVSLMKDKLTDVDTSTNTRLQSFLSEMSTCVLYDPPEEFTHRPKSTHLRTFPSKPSTDLDECIIRKNQAIYMASTSDAVSNAAIVNKTKRITNGSPTLQLKRGLVPFDKRMKWTRTVVNSTAENHVTSDDPGSSIDVNSAILNKKSKICSSLNYVPPPGASVIQGMAVSKNAVFVTADAIQTVTELRKHSPREIVCKIQSANGNQHKPYTLPLRNQLSLRNINGKTYQKDSRECFAFASGNCTAGIFCHFYHNGSTAHSEKVVCSRLLKGLCRPDNESCPLDHGLLEHQYPICSFYLREDCSESEKCKLLHVKHAPATPPCMEFNKGICFKGIECEQPHRYRYNVIKSMGCYNESTLEKDSSPSVTEERSLHETVAWIE